MELSTMPAFGFHLRRNICGLCFSRPLVMPLSWWSLWLNLVLGNAILWLPVIFTQKNLVCKMKQIEPSSNLKSAVKLNV